MESPDCPHLQCIGVGQPQEVEARFLFYKTQKSKLKSIPQELLQGFPEQYTAICKERIQFNRDSILFFNLISDSHLLKPRETFIIITCSGFPEKHRISFRRAILSVNLFQMECAGV